MDLDHVALCVDESFRQINARSIQSCTNPARWEQIELALLLENAPAFIELTNNLPSNDVDLDEELEEICLLMFMWDSAKCATAVLDGQTKTTKLPFAKIPKLPLSISYLSKVISLPLHHAAADSAFKITALLLQRGFSADVRGDYEAHQRFTNVLPLHVALSMTRFHLLRFDPPKEKLSAIMLVIKLCELPMRMQLETLRLIAQNTTDIKREFFNYLKEGKMLEVASLLLVAKSRILSPSTAKGEGEFSSISEMLDFVLSTRCLLSNPFGLIKNIKLVEMEETLVLLEIIDKIGDKLAALLRHDFKPPSIGFYSTLLAQSLIEDAGFDVKYIHFKHGYTRSQLVSYFLKRAIDECAAIDEREKRIRTSEILPSWVKEAALRGLRDTSGRTSRLTYPFPEALPFVKSNPMPPNLMPLHHLLKKTAPFLGTIKKLFRRG